MIKAIHPASGRRGTFSEAAWELLPTGKDGLKDGWKVEMPEEVSDGLQKKAAAEKRAAEKKAAADKKAAEKGNGPDNVVPEENAGDDPADEADADETNL